MAWIVIIGIAISVYLFLENKIGNFGIFILIILFAVCFIFIFYHQEKGRQRNFDALVLHLLQNRIPPAEAQKLNRGLSKENWAKSDLVRNLQIMRDSIDIALSSAKRDVAESRMDLALEKYRYILDRHTRLFSSDVMTEIKRVIDDAHTDFYTNLYINIAENHLERARNLKTAKSKAKHAGLAKSALEEGIHVGRGDVAKLAQALEKLEREYGATQ